MAKADVTKIDDCAAEGGQRPHVHRGRAISPPDRWRPSAPRGRFEPRRDHEQPSGGVPRIRRPGARRIRLRSGPAIPAGYQRRSRAARLGHLSLRLSCRTPAACQATESDVGDLALGRKVGPEGLRSHGGQPIRASPIVTLDSLDEALTLQPVQGLVERSRRQSHVREALDVLGQRIPVLRALRQAREDQRRRPGISPESGKARRAPDFDLALFELP